MFHSISCVFVIEIDSLNIVIHIYMNETSQFALKTTPKLLRIVYFAVVFNERFVSLVSLFKIIALHLTYEFEDNNVSKLL